MLKLRSIRYLVDLAHGLDPGGLPLREQPAEHDSLGQPERNHQPKEPAAPRWGNTPHSHARGQDGKTDPGRRHSSVRRSAKAVWQCGGDRRSCGDM